jgi:hypothetical protein
MATTRENLDALLADALLADAPRLPYPMALHRKLRRVVDELDALILDTADVAGLGKHAAATAFCGYQYVPPAVWMPSRLVWRCATREHQYHRIAWRAQSCEARAEDAGRSVAGSFSPVESD